MHEYMFSTPRLMILARFLMLPNVRTTQEVFHGAITGGVIIYIVSIEKGMQTFGSGSRTPELCQGGVPD